MTAAVHTLPCITKDLVKENIFIYASAQRSRIYIINVLPAGTGGKQPVQPARPGLCLDVPAALSCFSVPRCHICAFWKIILQKCLLLACQALAFHYATHIGHLKDTTAPPCHTLFLYLSFSRSSSSLQ